MKYAQFFIALVLAAASARAQNTSVVTSPHNLSAGGMGMVRAVSEQQICIFCHTPHNSAPIQPLWNRSMPVNPYLVYTSPSLKALPGQPTGSSKMCLSCHDGTIALGSVLSRGQPIQMAGGITTIPHGSKNLGTDLRDDHPISFRYDLNLLSKNPKLRNPSVLPTGIRLDHNQELQCTSCHDPHDNSRGGFLVVDNRNSQLCNACHIMGATNVSNHVQCASCHQQHSAPSGAYLLKAAKISDTCLECHGGTRKQPQGQNIAADLRKPFNHDTAATIDKINAGPSETSCISCHDSHTMRTGTTVAPAVPANFGQVSGVTAAGGNIAAARFEYEVCFKCHGNQNSVSPHVPRQIVQNNTRLQFDPKAVSFHPVEIAGRNPSVPSLRSPLTPSTLIYCSDCHASDSAHKAGGSGPNGTHGSVNRSLLVARYETLDRTTESPTAYALCYRCHERTILLSAQSSFPLHNNHVAQHQTPCSSCHDAHGISSTQGTLANNAHLINFDTTIVRPLNGITRYTSTGIGTGTCTLICHGKEHNNLPYR